MNVRLAGVLAVLIALLPASSGYAQAPTPPPRVFDLRLAVETALRNQPSLATAEAASQSAKTGIAVAGAAHRPFIDTSLTIIKTITGSKAIVVQDGFVVSTLGSDPDYILSPGVTIPIVREGRLVPMSLPSEKLAQEKYDAAWFTEQLTRSQVVRDAAVAFFSVLSDKQSVKAAEEQVELNRLLLHDARQRFEQQLIAQANVLVAEASLAAAETALQSAQASLSQSLGDFVTALGLDPLSLDPRQLELVEREGPLPPMTPLDALLKQAASHHPSVLAQAAKVDQAVSSLKLVESERYPTLDAVVRGSVLDNFGGPVDVWSLRALIVMNWKIFDFGSLSLRIKQQNEILEQERRTVELVRNNVAKTVIAAFRNFVAAWSGLASAQKSVEATAELLRNARQQFAQNQIALSAVRQAEVNLVAAQTALAQTQYNIRIQHAMLQAAAGIELRY